MSAFAAVLSREAPIDEALLQHIVRTWGADAPDGSAVIRLGATGERVAEDAPCHVALLHGLLKNRENATLGPHTLGDGVWIAGDVRLDARDELRAALRAGGSALRDDDCDDTLVLRAYAQWGDRCVERLLGDFSFALYDGRARSLLCARDGLGVRPLFYADIGALFVCGNVLNAVRAHPQVGDALDERAVVSFLQWGFNTDDTTTTFARIARLAPARQFRVTAGRGVHDLRRHWDFPVPEPLRYRDEREYVEHYRALLDVAVRDRLRVPSATILLSGGLDSTSIAATARRVAGDTALYAHTSDLSAHVPDDEARLAGEVARRLGIPHEIRDAWSEPLEYLDDAFTPAEPLDGVQFSDSRRASAAIAARSRVVFVGEDGDSLFDPPSLWRTVHSWPVLDVAARAVRFAWTHHRAPHTGLWLRRRVRDWMHPPRVPIPSMVLPEVARRSRSRHPQETSGHPTRPEAHSYLSSSVWQSMHEASRPSLSGVPLESRWPLFDARLIAFVFSIPPIPWCQAKELTRVAFRGELPDVVLRRAKAPVRGDRSLYDAGFRRGLNARTLVSRQVASFVDTDKFRDIIKGGRNVDFSELVAVVQLDWWLSRAIE